MKQEKCLKQSRKFPDSEIPENKNCIQKFKFFMQITVTAFATDTTNHNSYIICKDTHIIHVSLVSNIHTFPFLIPEIVLLLFVGWQPNEQWTQHNFK